MIKSSFLFECIFQLQKIKFWDLECFGCSQPLNTTKNDPMVKSWWLMTHESWACMIRNGQTLDEKEFGKTTNPLQNWKTVLLKADHEIFSIFWDLKIVVKSKIRISNTAHSQSMMPQILSRHKIRQVSFRFIESNSNLEKKVSEIFSFRFSLRFSLRLSLRIEKSQLDIFSYLFKQSLQTCFCGNL